MFFGWNYGTLLTIKLCMIKFKKKKKKTEPWEHYVSGRSREYPRKTRKASTQRLPRAGSLFTPDTQLVAIKFCGKYNDCIYSTPHHCPWTKPYRITRAAFSAAGSQATTIYPKRIEEMGPLAGNENRKELRLQTVEKRGIPNSSLPKGALHKEAGSHAIKHRFRFLSQFLWWFICSS